MSAHVVRPALRLGARRVLPVAAALGVALIAAAGPAAAAPVPAARVGGNDGARISDVTVDCTGDSLAGEVQVYAPGATTITVTYEIQAQRGGPFRVGGSRTVPVTRVKHRYPYQFDVSSYADSWALRVRATGVNEHATKIRTDTCAPGTEVPQAAVAVALPASLVATGGVVFAGARVRRRRTAATSRP